MKMSSNYMAELHRMVAHEQNIETIEKAAKTHLRYIPHHKIYRYRPCVPREFLLLESDEIWLADPRKYPDSFDATLSMKSRRWVNYDFPASILLSIIRKIEGWNVNSTEYLELKEAFISKRNETIDNSFEIDYEAFKSMEADMANYGLTFNEMRQSLSRIVSPLLEREGGITDFIDSLVEMPRKTMAMASFTTSYDNLSMWEHYANYYTGFCVEYDLDAAFNMGERKAYGDILQLFPISYYSTRPQFNYEPILEEISESIVFARPLSFKTTGFFRTNVSCDAFQTERL